MIASPITTTVRLLLSAVLLLPGGGVSEIRHTHAGGDRPHDHEGITGHDHHTHHNSDRDHDCLSRDAAGSCLAITNCVSHVHVTWFGIHLTCPLPINSQGTNHDSHDGTGTILVQSLGNLVSLVPTRNVAAAFVPFVDNDVGPCQEVVEPASARFSSIPAVAARLCDTARHERSGVQLI